MTPSFSASTQPLCLLLRACHCVAGVACVVFLTLATSPALAQGNESMCGPLANAYGPFDYRQSTPQSRNLVERFHFTPKVEMLQAGQSGYLGGDLCYTLRAYPNHARALMSLSRLAIREKSERLAGAIYPVECYFDRAERFAPDDPMVLLIHGLHKLGTGDARAGRELIDKAAAMGSDDINFHYNAGLAYVRLNEPQLALEHAKRAYAGGFPLPGLKDQLRRMGVWVD